MADEAGQDMVRVLPDGLGDDDRRVRIDLGEDLQALLLAGDEPVAESRVVRVGALDLDVERIQRRDDLFLHGLLRGPAGFVGALAQVAARRHQDFLTRGHDRFPPFKARSPRPRRKRPQRRAEAAAFFSRVVSGDV